MVAKELWSVARDKKSLPVVKISYLDRVSSLESKNIWLLRSYGRNVAGDKKSLPVKKNLVAKELFSVAKDKKSLPVVKLIKMTSHSITMETESRRYFRF